MCSNRSTNPKTDPACVNVNGLWDLFAQEGLTDFGATDERLILASKVTLVLWAFLTGAVLLFAPSEAYQHASSQEKQVCSVAFCLLLLSTVSRFLPILYADRFVVNKNANNNNDNNTEQKKKTNLLDNGFIFAAFSIQFIAMVACGLMAFTPTPVLIDPISGTRVFLIRWCEWAPLGFLLTFLSEEIDVPTTSNRKMSLFHSILQGTIVLNGFIFPLVSNPTLWWSIAFVAVVCFSFLYVRVYQKGKRLQFLRRHELARSKLRCGEYQVSEAYERCRLSHQSLAECAVIWTILVILHFVAAFLPHYVDVEKLTGLDPLALPMIAETFCEVLSKHLHILVVESVFHSFSSGAQNRRVLDQLRRIMSVFWERASDALVLSLKTKNTRICLASPTFLSFMGLEHENLSNQALVFELPYEDDPAREQTFSSTPLLPSNAKKGKAHISNAYILNIHDLSNGSGWQKPSVSLLPDNKVSFVESLGQIIRTAGLTENYGSHQNLLHEFERKCENGKKSKLQCEATITTMEAGSVLVVLRDISDRIQRFEAEKKLAIETTEREKDSKTNRFTRHEVKNGLLAGIYLCDTMKENIKNRTMSTSSSTSNLENNVNVPQGSENKEPSKGVVEDSLTELEATLHEVLDTVLSEAMARDVVHEAYIPREEAVDIGRILGTTRSEVQRFPLKVEPAKLPPFFVDKQLLRYIHRNAISNACKYGKRDGVVQTNLRYDQATKLLRIEIVNEPGFHHERLVRMGEEASKGVFEAGRQLHALWNRSNERDASVSSGDGAWIMRHCARMMGGDVGITFNPERTIFNWTLPAKLAVAEELGNACTKRNTFEIPPDTWGIVIDDSKVQRKLLGHLLSLIGIHPDHRVVLGATAEEAQDFHLKVKKIMGENPESKFFVIADENLDFFDSSGVSRHQIISGSLCIERLLRSLNPADEDRLLAVVRSANDAASDIETYQRRTHGFMPKEPIRKDKIVDLIQPLWEQRFPPQPLQLSQEEVSHLRATNRGPLVASGSNSSLGGSSTSTADLIQSVEAVDGLIRSHVKSISTGPQATEQTRWLLIREKLLVLQGDMMTLTDRASPRVNAVIDALRDLRLVEDGPPADLLSRWKLIRALIVSLV